MAQVRRARDQAVPRSWPVTATKPKLRTDAPLASRSRSMTMTRSPLSAAARAHDIPMMPAPTTARSKTPERIAWELMEPATQLRQHHDRSDVDAFQAKLAL